MPKLIKRNARIKRTYNLQIIGDYYAGDIHYISIFTNAKKEHKKAYEQFNVDKQGKLYAIDISLNALNKTHLNKVLSSFRNNERYINMKINISQSLNNQAMMNETQ